MSPTPRALLIVLIALALLLAQAPSAYADSQIHIVQPGDTLFKIAVRYGVHVQAIKTANGIVGDRIYSGQSLIIPDPNAPAAQPSAQTSGAVHVVQPGETLFKISLKYNVHWTAIQSANGLSGTKILSGQQLVIPGSSTAASPAPAAPVPPAEPQPSPPSGGTTHIVQPGETLFKIGLKYNLPWTAIQSANGLGGTKIFSGQRLVIPASTGNAGSDSAPSSPPPPPAAGAGGKRFVVDLSEQRLYAYEGDTLVRSTLISSGTWRYPTVTGTFYVYLRYTSARMRGPGYDLRNVPYVMYFHKSYGLHGTYWHNNFGTPMSHGCVNLPTPEAEWAFNWSTYGTPVIVQQ